eukprot:1134558-Alexandrium_andersonii.AAC.1
MRTLPCVFDHGGVRGKSEPDDGLPHLLPAIARDLEVIAGPLRELEGNGHALAGVGNAPLRAGGGVGNALEHMAR